MTRPGSAGSRARPATLSFRTEPAVRDLQTKVRCAAAGRRNRRVDPRFEWLCARDSSITNCASVVQYDSQQPVCADCRAREALRLQLSDLLCSETSRAAVEPLLRPSAQCRLLLPFAVGDYTDSIRVFITRPMSASCSTRCTLASKLQVRPDWISWSCLIGPTIRRSSRPREWSTSVRRETTPSFGPSRQLDYELELGLWIGSGNPQGKPIPIAEADDHIAGFVFSTTGLPATFRPGVPAAGPFPCEELPFNDFCLGDHARSARAVSHRSTRAAGRRSTPPGVSLEYRRPIRWRARNRARSQYSNSTHAQRWLAPP